MARWAIRKIRRWKCSTGTRARRVSMMALTKSTGWSSRSASWNSLGTRRNLTSTDAAPVRCGEELDLKGLDQYLCGQLAQLAGVEIDAPSQIEIEQFPGGHSNLTYLVRFGEQEFVLRRPPAGPVAPTAHDMPREFRLLAAIHPEFPLAPRPILLCEDVSVIGVPFYVMERRRGLIVRNRIPREIGKDLTLRHRVSESVVNTLVALHGVDVYATKIVQIGKPSGFVARQ